MHDAMIGARVVVWGGGVLVVKRFLNSSTPHREAFIHLRHQTVSSHDLDQHAWASHLARHPFAGPVSRALD
jgi:hypothetical protein